MEGNASNSENIASPDLFEVFGSDAEEFDSDESRDSFSSMLSSIARSSDIGDEALSERAVAHSFAGATDGSANGSSYSGRSISSTSSSQHDDGSNPTEPVAWPEHLLSTVYVPVLQEVHTLVSSNVPTGSSNMETHESTSDEDNEEQRRVWRRLGQEQKMKRKLEASQDQGSAKRSCDEASGSAEGKETAEPRVAMCSVCLEEIDEGGEHRLVALKCGHPFGESCVKKWLDSMKQSCPLCNRRAKLKDIRVVFLDCCRVGTSFELAEARKEASELRTSNAHQQAKMHDYELQLGALRTENVCLRERLRTLERGLLRASSMASADPVPKSTFPSSYSFTRLSGLSKYMSYSDNMNLVAVSMRPTAGLFDGGGVELCSLYDLKSRRVKILHRKEIKDLSFHPSRPWLLTASLDNTGRISDVTNMNLSNVHNIQLATKVWSCCWSRTKDTNFYLGLATGLMYEYDVRMISEPVHVLRGEPRRVPIASMKSFEIEAYGSRVSGIACTQVRNSVRLYREGPHESVSYIAQNIPVSGYCFSLFYDKESSSMLVSSRESRTQTVKNEIWELSIENNEITTNLRSDFRSGGCAAVISKPIICQSQSQESWACCLDDRGKAIQVFSCADGSLRHVLATQDPEQAPMTQVESVKLPGRSQFALLGLSLNGLSTYS